MRGQYYLVGRAVWVVVLVSAVLQAATQRLDCLCRLRPHVLHHHSDIPGILSLYYLFPYQSFLIAICYYSQKDMKK